MSVEEDKSIIFDDEIALSLGRHFLQQYQKWTERPMGKSVTIPFIMPSHSHKPDWSMSVTCNMPWFIETYFENGERKFKHWSLKDWHKKTRKRKK